MLLFFHLIIVMRSQNIWNTTKTSIPFGCCALSFTVCVSLFILFFFFLPISFFFECVFVPFLTVRFISVLVFVHIPFVRLTSSFKHSYSIFFIAFFVIHCWVFSLGCTVTKQLARVFFFFFDFFLPIEKFSSSGVRDPVRFFNLISLPFDSNPFDCHTQIASPRIQYASNNLNALWIILNAI